MYGKTLFPIKQLEKDHVVVKDRELVENKLTCLIKDGVENLQVIADFDSTLTKSHVDGIPTEHSIDILTNVESLTQGYREGYAKLGVKYGALLKNPTLTEAQTQKLLDQWWVEHEEVFSGESISVEGIQRSADSTNTPLRDGCESMLLLLSQHKVPLTVVSAGLGEVVAHVLSKYKPRIVSNFIKFDDRGKVVSFIKPTVSIYNKHQVPLPVDKNRHNMILLGDSLGDVKMADNVPNINAILKIGFFAGKKEGELEKYRDSYDIVLVEDQTMDTVNVLLKLVIGSP